MMYRCLIANRGEIAVRIIRELNIETVAIYAKGDENSYTCKFSRSSNMHR